MIRLAFLACLVVSPVAIHAQTLAVKDSVGAVVGFYVGPGSTAQPIPSYWGSVRVISASGYSSSFNARRGRSVAGGAGTTADGGMLSNEIYFLLADCAGQGYVWTGAVGAALLDGGLIPMPGTVFPIGAFSIDYLLWYVPKNATPVLALSLPAVRSRLESPGVCQPMSAIDPQTVLYPAAPNDPAVTGFPNVPFVPPLTIEPVPVSAVFSIFRDSFESPHASIVRDGLIGVASPSIRYS